ncbi:MAG: hypothetical protein EBS89_08250 [Proteobacteria bacterium]|nr:hypothetical protein [Pseudomonadota bacterium]
MPILAWVWTRVFPERLRIATMWWLNEKVAVRVVAVVPGPHGSVLVRVRRGRFGLPSRRLGRLFGRRAGRAAAGG